MAAPIPWIPVDSSAMVAIARVDGQTYVEMHNGNVYAYNGVPDKVYALFLVAPSKGTFFSTHIAKKYAFARIR